MNEATDQSHIRALQADRDSLVRERGEWIARYVRQGYQLNDAMDEITRLRRSMPAQVLREYDRRHHGLEAA